MVPGLDGFIFSGRIQFMVRGGEYFRFSIECGTSAAELHQLHQRDVGEVRLDAPGDCSCI